jgi:hypothetical protein
MKINFLTPAIIFLILSGCISKKLSGLYVCDNSKTKKDTIVDKGDYSEITMNLDCMITQFDFIGNSTVNIGTYSGNVASSYIVDKKYVRIKGSGADILLKIQDKRTLKGESLVIGTYHKK